jgi:hypothetical protein
MAPCSLSSAAPGTAGIVLEGHFEDTQTTCWIFSDIRDDSIHCRAEEEDLAGTVRMVQTMGATRVDASGLRCRTSDP